MDKIQELMTEITVGDHPSVYNISLSRKDHSSLWSAYATLRADGRHFCVEHEDPIVALTELRDVIDWVRCPECGQIRKEV